MRIYSNEKRRDKSDVKRYTYTWIHNRIRFRAFYWISNRGINMKTNAVKTRGWNFKNKKCIICNSEFKPIVGKQITCSEECSEKVKLKNSYKWNRENRDLIAKRNREYAKRAIEHKREYQNKYTKKNKNYQVRNETKEFIRKNKIDLNGKCLDCGIISKREVHHLCYSPSKFILLCKRCHYKRHNKELRCFEQTQK